MVLLEWGDWGTLAMAKAVVGYGHVCFVHLVLACGPGPGYDLGDEGELEVVGEGQNLLDGREKGLVGAVVAAAAAADAAGEFEEESVGDVVL